MSQPKEQLSPVTQNDHRCLAFQLLYTLDRTDHTSELQDILDIYAQTYGLHLPMDAFAVKICQNVCHHISMFDQMISQNLVKWTIDRISLATKILLRMAISEMMLTPTPHPIIINEYIELAKGFAENDSPKFINGLLDRVSKQITEKLSNPE